MVNRRDAKTPGRKEIWSLGAELLNFLAALRFGVSASRGLILFLTFASVGCSIPNLDPPECAESRTVIQEFYSFHFGNEMRVSSDGLAARKEFLTPEMFIAGSTAAEGTDPFTTGTNDIPKAFRAGQCRVISPERTDHDVLLFWKDDSRTEQRVIKVQVAKIEDGWLIDKINR